MIKVTQQSISLYQDDLEKIETIKRSEGLASISAVIRFVLRRFPTENGNGNGNKPAAPKRKKE